MKKQRLATTLSVVAAVAVLLGLVGFFVVRGVRTENAKKAGDRRRAEIKASFSEQIATYNEAFSLSSAAPYKGREYCVILTESDPQTKVDYASKSVGDEALETRLKEFARETGIDVIYATETCVSYKIFFESDRNERSEASFVRFFDAPPGDATLTPLQDGWYYSERILA